MRCTNFSGILRKKNGSPNLGKRNTPSDNQQKQENLPNSGLGIPGGPLSERKKENENWDKYLEFARELKKPWNMKVIVIMILVGALGTIPKGLVKTGRHENKKTSRFHLDYNAKVIQNTKNSPGDVRRLVVKLMWETIGSYWRENSAKE